MAKPGGKAGRGKARQARAEDTAEAGWVLVRSPEGVPDGTPVVVDSSLGAGGTGTGFEVPPGRHRFRVEAAGAAWSGEADCLPASPRRPQVVSLVREAVVREAAAMTGGVLRPMGAAPSRSLVAKLGSRPGAQTVVYVHGIGNKPVASILKCQWDTALFGTAMGDRTRMAYWVDRDRYPRPEEASCADPDRTATEDDEMTTSTVLALAAAAAPQTGAQREEAALERELESMARSPAQRRVLEGMARRLAEAADQEMPAEAARNRPGRAGARILPFGEATRRMLARLLTRVFLRDVNEFLFDAVKRERMTRSLWDRLRGGGEPFVVIAHSQGSMVAYELLRGLRASDCDVALLVTIGSPLGMQEVQDHFRLGGGRLATPDCVRRWVNVADRLDPVAIDPTLEGEYAAGASPETEVVDRVGWLLNPDSPRHPHSASGYLRTAAVRDAVREVVGNAFAQPVAGAVVAKDVTAAAEDAEAEETHDVLIQLADMDGGGPPRPLDEVAAALVSGLRELAAGRPSHLPFEEPDILRRFVQARLTRAELDGLRTLSAALRVKQVWANAKKRGLIHVSAATVQAPTGNMGYAATGRGIGWAVLDTGIDWNHPHFDTHDNVRRQWDCLDSGPPRLLKRESTNEDPNGHGTHVAGIIAGMARGVLVDGKPTLLAGMAPETTLYGFRVLDARAEGSDASIIKALDKIAAINEGASALVIHGVNVSLGANFDPSIYGAGHTPLCQELRRLWRQGVVICIAAGNEGYAELRGAGGVFGANMDLSIGDPANLEEAIAVGSVHKARPHTYGVSYFSSRGPTADGRRKPDLVAPGEKILSAMAGARGSFSPDGGAEAEDWYVEMSGTSMAAPHVSGVLAGFLSARREFIGEPDRVKRILLANCTDLARDPNMQGAGLVNLVKMLVAT